MSVKGKDNIANTNQVSMFEERSAFDHLFVYERTIAAVEVFVEKTHAIIAIDLTVIAADRTNIDHDIAFGVPTKDRFLTVEFISPTGLRTIVRGKKGHPTSILGMRGGVANSKRPPKGMRTRRF